MFTFRHAYLQLPSLRRAFPVRDYTRPSTSFVDRIAVVVHAGKGGSGCASFSRGPNQEIVPPDGGHGGAGGSVYLESTIKCATLHASLGNLRAEDGGPGRPGRQNGRRGKDLVLQVPPGTVVRELAMKDDDEGLGLSSFDEPLHIAELNGEGERAIMARGGEGGRGNISFKSSTNRSPEHADKGGPGETRRLELELKSIADVGLVGMPNAGKSTLLRAMSEAKPRVAAYPFTTLQPHIGVVKALSEKNEETYKTLSVADIPGLIEGAHENRGLGHEFLRHIERTKVLVYVLDLANERVVGDLEVLRRELEMHEDGLSHRRACIVANKMDMTGSVETLKKLVRSVGDSIHVFPVSAKYRAGIEPVVQHLSAAVL